MIRAGGCADGKVNWDVLKEALPLHRWTLARATVSCASPLTRWPTTSTMIALPVGLAAARDPGFLSRQALE